MATTPNSIPNPFRQTNAFAMNYALLFGLYWIAGFICFVNSLQHTLLSLLFYFILASSPVIGYIMLRNFRDRVCNGIINFGRGYLFTMLLYFYAALLLALAVWIYFKYLDHGEFISNYINLLESPDIKAAFAQENVQSISGGVSINDLKRMLENLQTLSPIVYAANVLDINIFLGIILAIPTALIAASRKGNSKSN